jgi:hypothetical protein
MLRFQGYLKPKTIFLIFLALSFLDSITTYLCIYYRGYYEFNPWTAPYIYKYGLLFLIPYAPLEAALFTAGYYAMYFVRRLLRSRIPYELYAVLLLASVVFHNAVLYLFDVYIPLPQELLVRLFHGV